MDHSAKAYPILSRIHGIRRMYAMLTSLQKYDTSDIAHQRLKIMQFFDQYGERATKEAFGADRKVISRWRQRLHAQRGKLQALMPTSTRPQTLRASTIHPQIVAFIKQERELHVRVGKEKLKPDVDVFCVRHGIPNQCLHHWQSDSASPFLFPKSRTDVPQPQQQVGDTPDKKEATPNKTLSQANNLWTHSLRQCGAHHGWDT